MKRLYCDFFFYCHLTYNTQHLIDIKYINILFSCKDKDFLCIKEF